jgi:TetR/AcrR family transcriptional repressor of lmrAB and yxaGH operons
VAKGEVRDRMVAGAVRLLAEKGPPGASFGDVLGLTGASRGSTYHHFPGGKRELYQAAIDLASHRALQALEPARGKPADVVVKQFFAMWRSLLTGTELRAGCAVLAVAVAGEESETVEHAGEIFRTWRAHLEALFVDGGLSRARARALAALTITSAEGAVAIARAEQDLETFELVARQVIAAARAWLPTPSDRRQRLED